MAFNEEEYKLNFDFSFKASVANNIRIATNAFREFWISNQNFLRNADDLYGRLLSYAVNQQFLKSSVLTATNYLVSGTITNSYRGKAVFLNTADYITSVCRTNKPPRPPMQSGIQVPPCPWES